MLKYVQELKSLQNQTPFLHPLSFFFVFLAQIQFFQMVHTYIIYHNNNFKQILQDFITLDMFLILKFIQQIKFFSLTIY